METWVLIVWLYMSSSDVSPTITSIPGFHDEITCNSAAIKITMENIRNKTDFKTLSICVRQ